VAEYGLLDAQVAVLFGVLQDTMVTELAGFGDGGEMTEAALEAADEQILARIDADELDVVTAQVSPTNSACEQIAQYLSTFT